MCQTKAFVSQTSTQYNITSVKLINHKQNDRYHAVKSYLDMHLSYLCNDKQANQETFD